MRSALGFHRRNSASAFLANFVTTRWTPAFISKRMAGAPFSAERLARGITKELWLPFRSVTTKCNSQFFVSVFRSGPNSYDQAAGSMRSLAMRFQPPENRDVRPPPCSKSST